MRDDHTKGTAEQLARENRRREEGVRRRREARNSPDPAVRARQAKQDAQWCDSALHSRLPGSRS